MWCVYVSEGKCLNMLKFCRHDQTKRKDKKQKELHSCGICLQLTNYTVWPLYDVLFSKNVSVFFLCFPPSNTLFQLSVCNIFTFQISHRNKKITLDSNYPNWGNFIKQVLVLNFS